MSSSWLTQAFTLPRELRHLREAQLAASIFQEGLIDQLYDLMLDYFHTQASSISFPELALPTVMQVRRLLEPSE